MKNNNNPDVLNVDLHTSPLSKPKAPKPYTMGGKDIEDAKVIEHTPNPPKPEKVVDATNSNAGTASESGAAQQQPPPTPNPNPTPTPGGGAQAEGANLHGGVDPPPFTFNEGGPASPNNNNSPGSTKIPDDMGGKGAAKFADFLLDGFGLVVPKALESYAAINESKIAEHVNKGRIAPQVLDQVREINKNNKGAIKFSNEHKNFIKQPLEEVLAIHSLEAPPHVRLMVALVFVLGMMWFSAFKIRMQNQQIVDRMLAMQDEFIRQQAAKKQEEERRQASSNLNGNKNEQQSSVSEAK